MIIAISIVVFETAFKKKEKQILIVQDYSFEQKINKPNKNLR